MKQLIRICWVLFFIAGFALAQSNSLGGLFQGQQKTISGALNNLFSDAPAPAQSNANRLQYRSNAAVSTKVQKNFADNLVKSGNLKGDQEKQLRQAIAQALTPANLEKLVTELFPTEKFSARDIGDAAAMFFIACFGVVQNLDQTTPQQNLAVRQQIRAAFLKTPNVLNLNDEQKQTISETMLYFMIFMLNDYQQVKQGTEGYSFKGVQGYTKNLLIQLGLDPATIQLGDKGLERKTK